MRGLANTGKLPDPKENNYAPRSGLDNHHFPAGLTLSAAAQQSAEVIVPPMVNFSGMLTDVNGKPLTGVVGKLGSALLNRFRLTLEGQQQLHDLLRISRVEESARTQKYGNLCYRMHIGRASVFAANSIIVCVSEMNESRLRAYGNIVPGVFMSVLNQDSKSFSLIDSIWFGVDFEPMRKQVEAWQRSDFGRADFSQR
jgi:hypothetical protein